MDRKSLVPLLLFIPPSLILFTVFVVLPMIDAATFSFFDWTGYGPITDFVGFENYEDVADPPQFRHGGPQQPARRRGLACRPAAAGHVVRHRARRARYRASTFSARSSSCPTCWPKSPPG